MASSIIPKALNGDISSLNDALASIEMRNVNYAYSLTSGGNGNTNLKTLIDAELASGEKCLGVVGFSSENTNVVITSARYSNSANSLRLHNLASSAQTGTAYVWYLCAKI